MKVTGVSNLLLHLLTIIQFHARLCSLRVICTSLTGRSYISPPPSVELLSASTISVTPLNPRGYGPHKSLQFTGEAEKFEPWEVKLEAYLRLNSLHKVIETVVDSDRNA